MNKGKEILRRQAWDACGIEKAGDLVDREWLVTNGLGGYASGTVSGVSTRRYHGLLIAALPAPLGRTVMLSHVYEQIRLKGEGGRVIPFGGKSSCTGVSRSTAPSS